MRANCTYLCCCSRRYVADVYFGWNSVYHHFCLNLNVICRQKNTHKLLTDDDIHYTFFSGWWQFPSQKHNKRHKHTHTHLNTIAMKMNPNNGWTLCIWITLGGVCVCICACASVRQVRLPGRIQFIPILISDKRNGQLVSVWLYAGVCSHWNSLWLSDDSHHETLIKHLLSLSFSLNFFNRSY